MVNNSLYPSIYMFMIVMCFMFINLEKITLHLKKKQKKNIFDIGTKSTVTNFFFVFIKD
jgi:hypothetical protein